MEGETVALIGITRADFWNLTAIEYEHLTSAYRARVERDDRRVARVLAMIYNVNRGRNTPAATEADFIPKPVQRQSAEQMYDAVRAWHRLLA
jgi:hypothetical protein